MFAVICLYANMSRSANNEPAESAIRCLCALTVRHIRCSAVGRLEKWSEPLFRSATSLHFIFSLEKWSQSELNSRMFLLTSCRSLKHISNTCPAMLLTVRLMAFQWKTAAFIVVQMIQGRYCRFQLPGHSTTQRWLKWFAFVFGAIVALFRCNVSSLADIFISLPQITFIFVSFVCIYPPPPLPLVSLCASLHRVAYFFCSHCV